MGGPLAVERDGHLAIVTISRPEKLNALDPETVAALLTTFKELDASRETAPRAAILTGSGKAFVAGADISVMAELSTEDALRFAEAGHALGALLETVAFPVIAAVNGFALGGGTELALACDLILASEKAKFGQPEVKLGVIPGFGGTQRLARRVGVGVARELCYTGDIISAERALAIGLANAVYPHDELLPKAREMAGRIAEQGPLAVSAAKHVILKGESETLINACQLEAQTFAHLFSTDDQREGMRAFLDKRPPVFKGR